MEEQLEEFITCYATENLLPLEDGVSNFIHHAVIAIANDCLEKCTECLITSSYLSDLQENLKKLLQHACEQSQSPEVNFIGQLMRTLMISISEPPYSLECLNYSASVQPVKLPCEEDFENIKLISRGSFGAVYLVRHKETHQCFAMKKIHKHNLITKNMIQQTFIERDILSFADSPFVVGMFGSFNTANHLCIAMEYVEGGDCGTLLKNVGSLPINMSQMYFAETTLALAYLHSYGIVHRDLKPENLLITSTGHIKVTDYGFSKIGVMSFAKTQYEDHLEKVAREFKASQMCGTPYYMAPEVLQEGGHGKPVDWWAMGIILYEFLVGCTPFFGDTLEEIFMQVLTDDVTWPDEDDALPADAQDLITKLLTRNPKERIGTAGVHEIKKHPFLENVEWNELLQQEPLFIPQLESEEDTSYFATCSTYFQNDSDEEYAITDDINIEFEKFSSSSSGIRKADQISIIRPEL